MRRAALGPGLTIMSLLLAAWAAQAQPTLPEGLDDGGSAQRQNEKAVPSLPEGLNDGIPVNGVSDPGGPQLPEGLGGELGADGTDDAPGAGDNQEEEKRGPAFGLLDDWRITGYVDSRVGPRLVAPQDQEGFSLAETRAEIKALRHWQDITATVTAHFVGDAVDERHEPDLQTGDGVVDLREANVLWRATDFMDVKAGRQILTWGTGEFVFLNDLFPKDYESFFIGRRDQMLKAPSDAVKISFYSDIANLDVVYTPQFDPDRYIDGDRLSYFNPFERRIVGDGTPLGTDVRDDIFADDEWAVRLHRLAGRYELALYGYDGFWKSPNALLPLGRKAAFAPLRVGGASARGPVPGLGGIANLEVAYYDSRDDRDGTDPNVPNSEMRLLLGYEREVITSMKAAVQYQRTRRMDHDAYLRTKPADAPTIDETSELWTFKLTKDWPESQVSATFFAFYSPSSQDGYLRPRVSWSPGDRWTLEAGVNWFFGADGHTEFGQLVDNSNVFVGARFGF